MYDIIKFDKEYVTLDDINNAYRSCRKAKRRKFSSLEYELNYEINNYNLYIELNTKTYEPLPSNAFCIPKPFVREVFAAQFKDRIVHHLIISKMNDYIEKLMVDYSCACRKNKGTLYGIKLTNEMMCSLAEKTNNDAWVLRGDIKGFFMSIDKNILWEMLEPIIHNVFSEDVDWWIWLIKKVIMNRPELNCLKKGNIKLWDKLPDNKTLFKTNGKGLPIGNYTSQIFANLYLTSFDKMVLCMIGDNGYYCRGADDFIIMHKSKKFIIWFRKYIKYWLLDNLKLELHNRKSSIQPVKNGAKFLGAFIKNGSIYPSKRTIYNVKRVIYFWNKKEEITNYDIEKFIKRINSYTGFLRQGKSFNKRKKILYSIKKEVFAIDNKITKISKIKKV